MGLFYDLFGEIGPEYLFDVVFPLPPIFCVVFVVYWVISWCRLAGFLV